MLHTWNHILCNPCRLAFFTQHNSLQMHQVVGVCWQYIPFYCWVSLLSYFMDVQSCLTIFLTEGPLSCFQCWLLWIKAAMSICVKVFAWNVDISGMNSQMYIQLLGHMAIPSLVMSEAAKLFARVLVPPCIPTCKERVRFSAPLPGSALSLFMLAVLTGVAKPNSLWF